MRKIFVLATMAVVALALAVAASANTGTVAVVSDTSVKVYGPLGHYAELGHSDWGTTSNGAVAAWIHPNWPSIPGATWISTAQYTEDPVNDSWRWFQGEMTLPCTAYNISATVLQATSDNAEEFYLNGVLVGSDGEVQGPFIDDSEWNTIINYSISPQPGVNTLDFIVRNYAMPGGGPTSNPTGLIYRTTVDYEVPDVVWQPPLTNADFALQDGTTLPLKFELYLQNGTLITDMQDVYLTVYGPSNGGPGTEIEKWILGDGVGALRFNDDQDQYIANFQTRSYNLASVATYTAVVHDSCTGDILGSFAFDLDASKGTGRGNSGK